MVRVGGRVLAGVSAALLGGAAMVAVSASANAADLSYKDAPASYHGAGRTLEVSGSASLTSDYIFRGFSQSDNQPALQATLDLTYGIFYAGVFASSIDFKDTDAGTLEVDLYAGIKPTWNGVTFDFGVIYYAYPGSKSYLDYDYWEFKAGVSKTLFAGIDAGVAVYYSPEYFGGTDEVWTVEGSLAKTLFTHRGVEFAVSGVLGTVQFDNALFEDYTYWNVGLTATFKEKYSIDVRYHDTDVETYLSDERVVVTGKVSF